MESKFLSETYDASEAHWQSDDVFRTIQSAKSELSAIYPPGTGPQLTDGETKAASSESIVPISIRNKAALDKALGSDAVTGRPQIVPVFNYKDVTPEDYSNIKTCKFAHECDDHWYGNPEAY